MTATSLAHSSTGRYRRWTQTFSSTAVDTYLVENAHLTWVPLAIIASQILAEAKRLL